MTRKIVDKRKLILVGIIIPFVFSCKEDRQKSTEQHPGRSGIELVSGPEFVNGEYILTYSEQLRSTLSPTESKESWKQSQRTDSVAFVRRFDRKLSLGNVKVNYLGFADEFVIIKTKTSKDSLVSLLKDSGISDIQQNYKLKIQLPHAAAVSSATENEMQWGVERITKQPVRNGNFRTAWVVDTGVDSAHEDLNYNETLSASFVPGHSAGSDEYQHGTHVAGIIGAIANGVGVIGVAPNAPIASVRIMDERGYIDYAQYLLALNYLSLNVTSGDVVNLSFVSTFDPNPIEVTKLRQIASRANVVIAAGNSSNMPSGLRGDIDGVPRVFPASINGTSIYTVSAFNFDEQLADFSNYGSSVDYSEPGVNIVSTVPGGYAAYDGTSMAAPHLAGLLLLGPVRSTRRISGDLDMFPDRIAIQ